MCGSRATLAIVLALFTMFTTGAVTAATVNPGDVLVADPGSGTIRHYSASGADLGIFASGLRSPSWIATDRHGNIYISEFDGARVDKFSAAGVILLTITTPYNPGGIQVDGDGAIYVADYFGGTVHRYSASGA